MDYQKYLKILKEILKLHKITKGNLKEKINTFLRILKIKIK